MGSVGIWSLLALYWHKTACWQLVKGSATWNSGANRSQDRDGAQILGFVVPIVISLMMEQPNQLWGDLCYPVVEA